MKLVPRRVHEVAAWLVRIEALLLFSLGTYLLVRTLTSAVEELDAVIAEILFLFLGALGLFFAGRGFLQQRNYGRGPTVLANLIAMGVAYYMIDGGRIALGVFLGSYALFTLLAALASIPKNPQGDSHQGISS
jgi:ABC-type arginine transport system permease subunit